MRKVEVKGLIDRIRRARNDNCVLLEALGNGEISVRAEVGSAVAEAYGRSVWDGLREGDQRKELALVAENALVRLASAVIELHYATDAAAGALDRVNMCLKRRNGSTLF